MDTPGSIIKVFEKVLFLNLGSPNVSGGGGGRPAVCRRIQLVLLVKWPILKLKAGLAGYRFDRPAPTGKPLSMAII